MVTALDTNGCFDFVLACDRDQADKTTLVFGVLRGSELDAIKARAEQGGLDTMEDAEKIAALSLRGWRRFRDHAGADVPFPPRVRADVFGVSCEVAAPEAMARLPLTAPDLLEILKAVMSANQVGAEAAKKSLSPLP